MAHATELERIYDAHSGAVFAFVLNLTRNVADTRDILQDLFRRLTARPTTLHGVRDERAFLLRLAHNLAIDLMRRRSVRERAAESLAVEAGEIFAPASDPDEAVFRRPACRGARPVAGGTARRRPLETVGRHDLRGHRGDARHSSNTAASRYRYALDKLRARLRPIYEEIQ